MSIISRISALLSIMIIGIGTAAAHDDALIDDHGLPCSAVCRAWMDFGREKGPVATAEPGLATAPMLKPASPPPAAAPQAKLDAVSLKPVAPRHDRRQFTRAVPLPVPRPAVPPPVVAVRTEEVTTVRPNEEAEPPVPRTAVLKEAPPATAAPEEAPLRKVLSADPPLDVASAPQTAVKSSEPPVSPMRSLVGPQPTPLSVKVVTWGFLAALVLGFFGRRGRAHRLNREDTPPLFVPRHGISVGLLGTVEIA